MKGMNSMKYLFSLLILLFSINSVAQKISLTGNFKAFNIDNFSSEEEVKINMQGNSTILINARIFSDNLWVFRFGAGIENLDYKVYGSDIQTDYEARRKDVIGNIGFEKHFLIGEKFTLYPGIIMPITLVGDEEVSALQESINDIENGQMIAGLGVLAGLNFKILKFFRIGIEYETSFDRFKKNVLFELSQPEKIKIKELNHSTYFTLGLAF